MAEILSSKTVQETLSDLKNLFKKYEIEDWEPIPGDRGDYSVRYWKNKQWFTIGSWTQSTKAKNARLCYQVIQYQFLWGERGVSGTTNGVTFIHGGLAVSHNGPTKDDLAEAYAIVGVEPNASREEFESVYRAKVRHQHPDGAQEPQEKKVREERIKRLNAAYDLIEKSRVKI